MTNTVTINQTTYTFLFPDLVRPLTEAERQDLRDDIRARGAVVVAVVVDEDNGVIDGINRLTIAAELGLAEVPLDVRRGLTAEQKRDLALALNANRRHLTHVELVRLRQERIKRVAAKRQEGKSLRSIAEEEGVSAEQVRQDVQEATVKGLTVEPEGGKVRGRDGKERIAKKKLLPKKSPPKLLIPLTAPAADSGDPAAAATTLKKWSELQYVAMNLKNLATSVKRLARAPSRDRKPESAFGIADRLQGLVDVIKAVAGAAAGKPQLQEPEQGEPNGEIKVKPFADRSRSRFRTRKERARKGRGRGAMESAASPEGFDSEAAAPAAV